MTSPPQALASAHVSVVVPVFDEEAVLPELRRRLPAEWENESDVVRPGPA